MKKLSLIILAIGLFSLLSCKKDETQAVLKSAPGAPSGLTVPGGAALVLDTANKNVLLKYTWNAANYGAQVIPSYTLQMDKQGNNFSHATALGAVNTLLTFSVLTSDLNGKLLPLLFDPSVPEALPMEFRVMTIVKDINGNIIDTIKPVYSVAVQQSITPYYAPIVYPLLNVPGSYQGWNPGDSLTTIASVGSNDLYEGYMNFPDANTEFKYAKGDWNNNWGDDGANGSLEPGGANIKAVEAGYYKLNVDMVSLTHTFLKTTWGLIGDATPGGWDTDTDMAYDAVNKVWTVTVNLTAAKIKFRANKGWDLNYGDNGGDGSLEPGGADISVPDGAGNYTVTLNLSKPIYKYKLVKN
jgi:hypothetical protein